jgi:hypothetical protein
MMGSAEEDRFAFGLKKVFFCGVVFVILTEGFSWIMAFLSTGAFSLDAMFLVTAPFIFFSLT